MHATAVEKIAPQAKDPFETPRRILPPALSFLLRRGLLALIALGVVLSVVLGLVQKWLWMRQLDYVGIFWTLLSIKWGIFGVTLIISVLYLWIRGIYLTPPDTTGCGLIKAANGTGPTCTAC
jgi:hypothetical protein